MDSDNLKIVSERAVFIDKPPCCLEFVPGFPEYFVVGTYNLLQPGDAAKHGNKEIGEEEGGEIPPSAATRNGSLILFQLADDNAIIKLDNIDVPYGILDLHFSDGILGAATSVGALALFKVTFASSRGPPRLNPWTLLHVTSADIILTSFSWHPDSDRRELCVTLASGSVRLATIPTLSTLSDHQVKIAAPILADSSENETEIVYQHSLEAWFSAYSPTSWDQNYRYVFSGGDDAVLSCTILNKEGNEEQASLITSWTSKRLHNAGVTAILPITLRNVYPNETANTSQVNLLVTGSYDDTLRIFHIASHPGVGAVAPKQAMAELNLGGGVWRIKLIHQESERRIGHANESKDQIGSSPTRHTLTLLICAMYAGAFIVRVTVVVANDGNVTCEAQALAHFTEHESMCYGCDFTTPSSSLLTTTTAATAIAARTSRSKRIVTCSFYDKRICVWKFAAA